MVDRFVNGNPDNDHAYGRGLKTDGTPFPGYQTLQGTFHGGDLVGLLQKIQQGYFTDLGVNALWITAPYEQIHGWVSHPARFRHYSYAGYWPLDFTEMDANQGTVDDLRNVVDAAHARGIKVLLDVVMNHAGYMTLGDMQEFMYGVAKPGWESFYRDAPEQNLLPEVYQQYLDFSSSTITAWAKWWSPAWIRQSIAGDVYGTPLPGYQPFGPGVQGEGMFGLPDFKTEALNSVGVPPVLLTKWNPDKELVELAELDAFFASTGRTRTVRNHIIKWLTDWVEELGVDGYRCDTAGNVELEAWGQLKMVALQRLATWKASHTEQCPDAAPFWMMGEGSDFLLDGPEYYANGFNAMLNFPYRYDQRVFDALWDPQRINSLYAEYAGVTNREPVSFLSVHVFGLFFNGDTDRQKRGGTLLMLTPRAINILYGDENARPLGPSSWDEQQQIRSDMVFPGNTDVLTHWQKLGRFRRSHEAVGAGTHSLISSQPYAFARTTATDTVVCVLGAGGTTDVNVSGYFANGDQVRDAYSGQVTTVQNGSVRLTVSNGNPLLIERAPGK